MNKTITLGLVMMFLLTIFVTAAETDEDLTSDVEAVVDSLPTVEEIAEDSGLSDAEFEEAREHRDRGDLKQHVHQRLLEWKVDVKLKHMQIVIDYINEHYTDVDTGLLESLRAELEAVEIPEDMDKETFADVVKQVKDILENFKEEATQYLNAEDKAAIRELFGDLPSEARERFERVRDFHNSDHATQRVRDAADRIKEGGPVPSDVRDSFKDLDAIRQKISDKKTDIRDLRTDWKESAREHNSRVGSPENRAKRLSHASEKVSGKVDKIRDAASQRELDDINREIDSLRDLPVAEAAAKERVLNARIANLDSDSSASGSDVPVVSDTAE